MRRLEGRKMSKIVARMEKMKTGNLGGIQRHNQRETDNHSNKEIDVTRSHLNYDLVNQESINYRERIHEIIDTQRVSKRAIRKDAVLVDEWIITSDKPFFETADSRKFFEDSVAYFSERCGAQNIAYAMVHLDETTPHMHLGIVPMTEGKLSSKQVFSRQTLKEIQDELPEYLQRKGHAIERGLKGSEQKHLTVDEYKENQREVTRMVEQVRDLKVKAEYMSFEMVATKNQLNEEAQVKWHDDWLVTKQEMSDFSMVSPISLFGTASVEINEHTAKEWNFDFHKVMELFREKYNQVKDYIAQKWQNLTRRELEIEKRYKSIGKRQNVLESKLEGLNANLEIKERQNEQLTELIESKTRYVEQLVNSSQLSMALPDYVKPSKLNKDVLLVPKEKWKEKHISSNSVKDMLRIQSVFSRVEQKIERQANIGMDNWELTREVKQLQGDRLELLNGFVRLYNSRKITEKDLRNSMSEKMQKEIGLEPVERVRGLTREHQGPSMGL